MTLIPLSLRAGGIEFNRDIRPILADQCLSCHGPDSASRKADLRLDQEADAKASAIVPGDPAASELIARIFTEDRGDLMPPPKTKKELTLEQKELLKQWIGEGANWQEHWAFIPPAKPDSEGETGIDHFVQDRLHELEIEPSPEASKRTLIRRVTLDLTGLPPTPKEVEAFLADKSPNAYEKVVDRLLASDRYGEHRARYWLDAARYADTHGLHLDNYREMWPYRDWVIGAFNENLPFDQFTIEQLAGDLLESPTLEQRIATGFNRCNVTTSEGGAIDEEFLVRYGIDRVNTTSTVWMGLTMGCAQCHDHKYDPISQKDYYQLFAFFNNTVQPAMDGNRPDTPPVLRIYPEESLKEKESKVRAEIAQLDKEIKAHRAAAKEAFETWTPEEGSWLGEIYALQRKPGEEVDTFSFPLSKDKPFSILVRVKVPEEVRYYDLLSQMDEQGRGFRLGLDVVNEGVELVMSGGPGKGELKVQQIRQTRPGRTVTMVMVYDGSGSPKGVTAWVGNREMTRDRFPYLEKDTLTGDFANEEPFEFQADSEMLSLYEVYDRALADEEIALVQNRAGLANLVRKPREQWDKKQGEEMFSYYLQTQDPEYQVLLAQRAEADLRLEKVLRKAPVTHVMQEDAEGMPTAMVLQRGEYDKPTDVQVNAEVPESLGKLGEDEPRNRLGLAQWLVDRDNPLTARVTVNRIWQEFFGTGLVKTSGDFGLQGESPSHPELLDWLAVDFVDHGWDIKRLIRQIVTSEVYRQSSVMRPELLKRDPENRLLARGPRFRLDAEMVRDQALFTSGLMVEKIGGPPVRPYQPDGLWHAVGYSNSNTVRYYRHHGESLYRRSIYTFLKRTAPPPSMSVFDAPDRESCTVRRERTNTPLQALVLMNDVQFVEAARHLAERSLEAPDPISDMAQRVLSRPLSPEERAIVVSSLASFRQYFQKSPEAAEALLEEGDKPNSNAFSPAEIAAHAMLASQFLNLDEAITKN